MHISEDPQKLCLIISLVNKNTFTPLFRHHDEHLGLMHNVQYRNTLIQTVQFHSSTCKINSKEFQWNFAKRVRVVLFLRHFMHQAGCSRTISTEF